MTSLIPIHSCVKPQGQLWPGITRCCRNAWVGISKRFKLITSIVWRQISKEISRHPCCCSSESRPSHSSFSVPKDMEPPLFDGCLDDQLVIEKLDSPGYDVPTASDNSGAFFSLTVTVDPDNFSPNQQLRDDIIVTYTATDLSGNTASCVLDIHIKGELALCCFAFLFLCSLCVCEETVTTILLSSHSCASLQMTWFPRSRALHPLRTTWQTTHHKSLHFLIT